MGIQMRHFTQTFPQVIKHPKSVFKDEKLLNDAVPIAAFLSPIGGLVFSPPILYLENRKKKTEPEERKKMVIQEFLSQVITAVVHIAAFVSGGKLARKALPKINPQLFAKGSRALENGETAACIAGSFVGITFIRPFVTAKLMKDKDNHDKGKPDDSTPGSKEGGNQPQQQQSAYQYYYA